MKHFQDEDSIPYDSPPIGGIHIEEDWDEDDHSIMWREEDSELLELYRNKTHSNEENRSNTSEILADS